MFTLRGNKKAIFIIIAVILLATITCVTAAEEKTTLQKNTTTQQTPTITKEITEKPIKTEENQENTDNTIYITETNYEDYKNYEYPENSSIVINDSLEKFEMVIEHKNITVTGQNNATLYNSHIDVWDDGVLHISNLTFITDDDSISSQTLYIESDNNVIDNLTFIEKRNTADRRTFYRAINVVGNNNTISNSHFDLLYPSIHINWDSYAAECNSEGIIVHGDNNSITNNEILIQEGETREFPFGTIFGVSIRGDNNLVDYNKVYMNGTIYLYGIRIFYSNNIVTNNYVEVHSIRYANGIAIESPNSGTTGNNTIRNNTVIVTTQNTTVPGEPSGMVGLPTDAAYAIMITEYRYTGGGMYTGERTNTKDNTIEGNTITGTSSHMYGIELFGSTGTTISKNSIEIEGVSAMGIAGGGKGTRIIDNDMVVLGQTSEILGSADYYLPQTSGVYLQYGEDVYISGNSITTENGAAVKTRGESGTTITDNSFTVYDHPVAVDIINSTGIATVIDNAIKDFTEDMIRGATGEGNYNLNTSGNDNPETQPGSNGTDVSETNNTDTNGTDNPEPEPEQNNTDVPETNNTDTNGTDNPEPEPEQNNTDVPETNNTDTNKTVVPEPEPEQNNTDVPEPKPEENETVVPEPEPEQNNTVVPEPEPEQNNTVVPEPKPEENETVVPEPEPEQNNTVVPEPEPEQNETTIPEPEPEQNETIIPEPEKEDNSTTEPTENNTKTETKENEETNKPQKNPTNNTIPPKVVKENNTNVPINQSTQPSTEPSINTKPTNTTDQKINQSTSSAGEEPDNNKEKNDNPEPVVNPEPQTEEKPEQEQNVENPDTSSEEPQETQNIESEEQQDDTRGLQPAATTATVNTKVYEINKKIPQEIVTDHAEVIIALLIILCVAFTYGYLKKR